jgi:hypothetical protein
MHLAHTNTHNHAQINNHTQTYTHNAATPPLPTLSSNLHVPLRPAPLLSCPTSPSVPVRRPIRVASVLHDLHFPREPHAVPSSARSPRWPSERQPPRRGLPLHQRRASQRGRQPPRHAGYSADPGCAAAAGCGKVPHGAFVELLCGCGDYEPGLVERAGALGSRDDDLSTIRSWLRYHVCAARRLCLCRLAWFCRLVGCRPIHALDCPSRILFPTPSKLAGAMPLCNCSGCVGYLRWWCGHRCACFIGHLPRRRFSLSCQTKLCASNHRWSQLANSCTIPAGPRAQLPSCETELGRYLASAQQGSQSWSDLRSAGKVWVIGHRERV